ncbi:pyridoxamine 5'-phosphate oxidase family protein [Pseudonocardia acaciae]|uniref:pyridoxamine 5'-phosphate oxidase family protein n=1 Tax=Pseudonocardia acaciae TaxID=551276 RepID=UPI0004918655|nr:pyridoxamine 5'-phosphate oxidase family protein [Pseudonocardia acaciae]
MSESDFDVPRSRPLSQADREAFLAQPHVAVLSVAGEGGRPPLTLPSWYAYRPGGTIAVIMRKGKRKSRLIAAAGVVSVSVQRSERPYRYVTVEGTVVRQERPTAEELAGVGGRYLPAESVDGWLEWELSGANPSGEPEYVEIRPDRWHTRDFS